MLTLGKEYFREQINPDADYSAVGAGIERTNLRNLQVGYAHHRRGPR